MQLVFMGTPEFAVPSLRALQAAGHEILAVVTQPDRPRRRQGAPPEASPVKREALSLDIPVIQPESARDPEFAGRLAALVPECVAVVAYGQILPPAVLAIPPRWCINVHASILPRYRGAAPIARAVMAGERVTGVTTMKMDRGLDTGDILLQRECAIGLSETAGELSERLAALGADLLVETLDRHGRGELDPRRQDAEAATQAPPLTRGDGRIDWSADAQAIVCRVLGCNPWPLAWSACRGRAIQVLRAEVSLGEASKGGGRRGPPGSVIAAGGRLLVECGRGSRVALLDLRLAGGRPISARDALNGRLLRNGDRLATPDV